MLSFSTQQTYFIIHYKGVIRAMQSALSSADELKRSLWAKLLISCNPRLEPLSIPGKLETRPYTAGEL